MDPEIALAPLRPTLSREDTSISKGFDTPEEESAKPSLQSPIPLSRKRRRWVKRFTSLPLIGRSLRTIRWILGPSTPVPDARLPKPSPSLAIHLSWATRSIHIPLDQPVQHFVEHFRTNRFLIPVLAVWAAIFILLVRQQYYITSPQLIDCTARLWDSWPPDTCGLNATGCEDYLETGTYRCLGGCLDAVLGNPRWIGGEEINGVPMVIGGQDGRYRADSWVCASAIQSGLISRTLGGCFTISPFPFNSPQSDFKGFDAHGTSSVSFAPGYPGAYSLAPDSSGGCLDIHPIVNGVNAFILFLVTLLLSPSPRILFSILVILGYAHLVLFSDPPSVPPYWETIFERLGPVLFASFFFWKVSFRRTLEAFRGLPVETAVWQGMGFWLGIESSKIFSKLPIQTLGYGKLSPGGVISIILIVLVVLIVVLIQAYQARGYGLLQYYIVRYLPLVPILIVLAFIPNYTLRLHHYLLATAALPVLSLPNRVSLFGQAFMFGLFLDGAGRWGMASILEYTASLLGDAVVGTGVPNFMANMSSSETISWVPLTEDMIQQNYTGVAVIVDDILRAANVTTSNYTFTGLGLIPGIDHFFRLAFEANGTTLDYTDSIALSANGTWTALG